MDEQLALIDSPSPTVQICIPPELEPEAHRLAEEAIHPAWDKAHRRGRHFVITTNSLEDITEIADFARVGIEEPEQPLTKSRRQALQVLLDRTYRYVELVPMGHCHCMATKWRDKPLRINKACAKAMKDLRKNIVTTAA